ncbi:MAG: hypothetical protein GY745_07920 [Actinomycetia bacterium]|nr:hypothetical protein [Actinomycetes bacterium]
MARTSALLAAALFIAACGGDSNEDSGGVENATTTMASITTTAPTAPTTTTTTTTTVAGPTEPTLTDNSSLSTVGLDTVTFGMTVRAAEAAAGTPLIPEDEVGDCYRVRPEEGPEGVSFLVTDGTIERIDVSAGLVSTRSGFGIGTPARQIIEGFADRINVESSAGGQRLVFTPADEADQAFRVIFDTDGTTVTALRSGRVPMVEWDACP